MKYPRGVVEVVSLGLRDTADSNGFFHLHGLCRGTYRIRILREGHLVAERQVEVPIESPILIEPEETIHEVVIQAHVPRAVHLSPLHTVVRAEGGLATQLSQVPGIALSQAGPLITRPIIEGVRGTRIAYWQAGQPLASHQWGEEHAPEIDPLSAEEVEVHIGPSPVRHGTEAVGGAIILPAPTVCCLRETEMVVFLTGIANGRGANLGLRLQGAWRGWGYRLQGSALRLGTIQTPTYYLTGTGTAQIHGSLTIHKLWERWQLRLFYAQYNARLGIFKGMHTGNLTDLNRAITATRPLIDSEFEYRFSPPYQDITHELVSLNVTHIAPDDAVWTLIFGRQYNRRSEYDLVGIYTGHGGLGLDLQLTTHFVHLSRQKRNWLIGAFVQHQRHYRQYAYFIPSYERWQGGVFFLYQKDKWEAGLRIEPLVYDFGQTVLRTGGSPIRGIRRVFAPLGMEISREGLLRTQLSFISRAPNPAELYAYGYHQSQAAFHVGANDLRTEPTVGFRAAWERPQISGGVGAYYSPAFVWQRLGEPMLSLRGACLTLLYVQSPAAWISLSMRWTRPLSRVFTWELRGAYVWGSVYQSAQQPMPLLPPLLITPSLQAKYRGWKVELYWQYQSRQTRYTLNAEYLPPPPGYGILGMLASWQIGAWQITISGDNLLNHSYRAYPDLMRFFANQSGRQVRLTLLYEAKIGRP